MRHIFEDSRSKKVFAFAFAQNGQNKWQKDSRWLFLYEKRIPAPGILEDLPHIFTRESSSCEKTHRESLVLLFLLFLSKSKNEKTKIGPVIPDVAFDFEFVAGLGWAGLGWAGLGWAGLGLGWYLGSPK